jgi:hypothetical protein
VSKVAPLVIAAEDKLRYSEPSDWVVPVRHALGAFLLKDGQATEAEAVYREDLRRWPGAISCGRSGGRRRAVNPRFARGARGEPGGVDSRRQAPYDFLIHAMSLRPPPILCASGLPTSTDGALLVDPFLRSVADARVFGRGDCIAFQERELAKVGVYAFRESPVLYHNLLVTLHGRPLWRFRPQHRFLLILNLGDGTGLLTWGSFSWHSRPSNLGQGLYRPCFSPRVSTALAGTPPLKTTGRRRRLVHRAPWYVLHGCPRLFGQYAFPWRNYPAQPSLTRSTARWRRFGRHR